MPQSLLNCTISTSLRSISTFLVVTAVMILCYTHTFAQAPSNQVTKQPSNQATKQPSNQAPKGHLVIIGGGPRPEAIMRKIVALAGGNRSSILVLPMASSEPVETAKAQMEQLSKFGAAQTGFINCTTETADADSNLAKVRAASGIFFSGGDQTRLMAALRGTKLLQEVWALYQRGGVIAGTSAGAAVQSRVMLTGDEAVNKDTANPYGVVQQGNIVTAEGMGFLQDAIVDQHFVKRKRQNRLLTLVLEQPQLLGIGIDEATCIIVKPNRTFEVLGDAAVQVFDASKARNIRADEHKNLSGTDIRVHILTSGSSYNVKTKTPERP